MRKTFLFLVFAALTLASCGGSPKYVDLGLPSGTLWSDRNEKGGVDDHFNFLGARDKFGDNLPTKYQIQELISFCEWKWTGKGYKVIGPNGSSIYLPADGWCNKNDVQTVVDCGKKGSYWTSDAMEIRKNLNFFDYKCILSFDSEEVEPAYNTAQSCFSVRLVK